MPDAAPPVNRYRRSLSRSNNNSAVLAIVYILSTLQQWFPCGPLLACHLTRLIRAFSFRVHDRGFWPKPPKVVWSLLLQADSEGPTLISQTVAHLLSLAAVCCARGTLLSVYRTSEFSAPAERCQSTVSRFTRQVTCARFSSRDGGHLHGERGRGQAAVRQGLSNRARRTAPATPGIVKLLVPPRQSRGDLPGLSAWHIILIVAQPGRKRDPDASAGEPPAFGKIAEDHFSCVFV